MDTAVIKLNSLADTVGASTENDYFFTISFYRFIFLFVR